MEALLNFKQADSDICIMENTLDMTIFQLFGKIALKLLTNSNIFGLAIPKLRKNILFYVSNKFWKHF